VFALEATVAILMLKDGWEQMGHRSPVGQSAQLGRHMVRYRHS
jgi:hypothetical protein